MKMPRFSRREGPRRRLIPHFEPADVTWRSPNERPAAEVGLDQRDIDAIWRSVEALYGTGLHPSVAFSIRRGGVPILERIIGHRSGSAPGLDGRNAVQADGESLFNLFSASKVVTAMLIHRLDQEGLLRLDDAVAEYIPEFARHGKGGVTIRHVLTHRAGFAVVKGVEVTLDLLADSAGILEAIYDTKPRRYPGRKLAYHAVTGGYVLGELIRRVTGKPIQQTLEDTITGPMGLESFRYGVREQDVHRIAQHANTGPPARPPTSLFFTRAFGLTHAQCVEASNDRRYSDSVIPSANIYGTLSEIGDFFECLLRQGTFGGKEIFAPRTVRRAVTEQSYLQFDSMILIPVRYGLGFMLGSDYASLYGPMTRNAYGHFGFTNILCWADPDRDISVVLMPTGKPFLTPKLVRWWWVPAQISRRISKVR